MNVTPRRKRSRTLRLTLDVQYGIRGQHEPSPAQLRRWVRAALKKNANITLRIVREREGHELNQRFRAGDHATNVLTFVYPDQKPLSGDIVICAPIVAREARAQNLTCKAHYAHLTVHGVLHLQGYDHDKDKAAQAMERMETRILAKLGYADPYRQNPILSKSQPAASQRLSAQRAIAV